MSIRVPLPSRRQLRTLTGLIQALKYHMNVASNSIITDESALGYINAAEDIDLTPLKTFFMKRSQYFEVAENGVYRINDLDFAVTEVCGVFYEFDNDYRQKEYCQYVDPITFGKGYGTVYTDALYTIDTVADGSNDQVIKVYPAPASARLGIEYYHDWAKLGDLTTNSKLQQVSLEFTGTASSPGQIELGTTLGTATTSTPLVIGVDFGDTGASIAAALAANGFMALPFSEGEGNSRKYWTIEQTSATVATLTSPEYISEQADIDIIDNVPGINITAITTVSPFVQTVQNNWLLQQYPYLYYYAALKHAYNGLDDTERYTLVEKEFLKAVQVFQSFTDRAEWGGVSRQPDYGQNVIW